MNFLCCIITKINYRQEKNQNYEILKKLYNLTTQTSNLYKTPALTHNTPERIRYFQILLYDPFFQISNLYF